MPATGVAGGFERLMLSLEKKMLFPDTEQNIQVFVAMTGSEVRKETIQVLRMLREAGIRADRDLKERPLRKQMEYASATKARLVVVIGPREIKEGKVRFRNMSTGNETLIETGRVAEEARHVLP
jgi:histidyl-tRNA synthetase